MRGTMRVDMKQRRDGRRFVENSGNDPQWTSECYRKLNLKNESVQALDTSAVNDRPTDEHI